MAIKQMSPKEGDEGLSLLEEWEAKRKRKTIQGSNMVATFCCQVAVTAVITRQGLGHA